MNSDPSNSRPRGCSRSNDDAPLHRLLLSFSHGEAPLEGHFSRQLDHRFSGPLSRLEHRGQQQRAPAGHAPVHLPATGPHRVPGRLPQLHREGPHRAVHDGGLGACWLVELDTTCEILGFSGFWRRLQVDSRLPFPSSSSVRDKCNKFKLF